MKVRMAGESMRWSQRKRINELLSKATIGHREGWKVHCNHNGRGHVGRLPSGGKNETITWSSEESTCQRIKHPWLDRFCHEFKEGCTETERIVASKGAQRDAFSFYIMWIWLHLSDSDNGAESPHLNLRQSFIFVTESDYIWIWVGMNVIDVSFCDGYRHSVNS